MDLPRIISVDDHVLEPAHLWEQHLPEQLRDRAPRLVRTKGRFAPGARGGWTHDEDGEWADIWQFEGYEMAIIPGFAAAGLDQDYLGEHWEPMTDEQMRPGACGSVGAVSSPSWRIDHVMYGVAALDAAAARFEAELGLTVLAGGTHPGGTSNRIVDCRDGSYVELIAVDNPTDEVALWIQSQIAAGIRLLGWAVQVDDIETVAARLGPRARRRQHRAARRTDEHIAHRRGRRDHR